MSGFLDTYNEFQACNDFEELWNKLTAELKKYSISSVGYGCAYTKEVLLNSEKYQIPVYPKSVNPTDMDSTEFVGRYGFIKANHPDYHIQKLAKNFTLMDDPNVFYCVHCTKPRLLHHRNEWVEDLPEKQLHVLDMFAEFGLGVGVSIPLRFGNKGVACFALCSSATPSEFDEIWRTSQKEIVEIVNVFDQFTRQEDHLNFYTLSNRRREVLETLAHLGNPQLVARELNLQVTTVYDHLAKIRQTLHVQNDIQAIVKAARFKLITP